MDVDLMDLKEVAHHGKGPHDPIGAEPGHGVAKSFRRLEDEGGVLEYPADSRGFTLAAVQAVARPSHARNFADANSFNAQPHHQNMYIYAVYNEFDTSAVNAKQGYKGSSNDHFRRPLVQNHDGGALSRQLLVRELPCWCAPCRRANVAGTCLADFKQCLARDEFALPRLVRLEKKSPDVQMAEIRHEQLDQHLQEWCTGQGSIVVVRPEEKDVSEP